MKKRKPGRKPGPAHTRKVERVHVMMDAAMKREARRRSTVLGMGLASYLRYLVAVDLWQEREGAGIESRNAPDAADLPGV